MQITVEDVQTFVEVVECGTLSAASERLGVSVSAVSKRLTSLEQGLGSQLMVRTTRHLSLTEAGQLFYQNVRDIPSQIETAADQVRHMTDEPCGALRVILPTYFANAVLYDEVIPNFLAQYPRIDLTVTVVADTSEHLHGDYDLLLVGRLPHQAFPNVDLKQRRLVKLSGALYASPDYLAQHGHPKHPNDLLQHNCLSYLKRVWHFSGPDGESMVIEPSGTLTTNSNEILRAATLKGMGIAYSFPVFFSGDVKAGRALRLLDEYTSHSFVDVRVMYRQSKYTPQRARVFLEALTAHFASED
jgi:DNA-binding transcriptional LysR family regulator